MSASPRVALVAVVAMLFSACSAITGLGDYDIVEGEVDAAADAPRDGTLVVRPESGREDRGEVTPDPDANIVEPVVDAGLDAPADVVAIKDATIVDALADARTGEPGIHCVTNTCNERCCAGFTTGFSCKKSDNACGVSEGSFDCDDGLDCAPGTVCCITEQGGLLTSARCLTSCSSSQEMACREDPQCPDGGRCLGKSSLALTALKTCR